MPDGIGHERDTSAMLLEVPTTATTGSAKISRADRVLEPKYHDNSWWGAIWTDVPGPPPRSWFGAFLEQLGAAA